MKNVYFVTTSKKGNNFVIYDKNVTFQQKIPGFKDANKIFNESLSIEFWKICTSLNENSLTGVNNKEYLGSAELIRLHDFSCEMFSLYNDPLIKKENIFVLTIYSLENIEELVKTFLKEIYQILTESIKSNLNIKEPQEGFQFILDFSVPSDLKNHENIKDRIDSLITHLIDNVQINTIKNAYGEFYLLTKR